MELKYWLIIIFGIFGTLNTYCFLFQRTVRKIRKFGFGSQMKDIEKLLYPKNYFILYYISFMRFIPLIWLTIIDWKLAILVIVVYYVIQMFIPVNDYRHIQKIKSHYKKQLESNVNPILYNMEIYNLILETEKRTL